MIGITLLFDFLLEIVRNYICTFWNNDNDFVKHGGSGTAVSFQRRTDIVFVLHRPEPECMTNMKSFVAEWLNAPSEVRLARRFTGFQTECGVKSFKCLLIRPSTLFPHSNYILFCSTSNYFNPVIAQRGPGLTVCRDIRCRERSVEEGVKTSAATGASSACLPPPGLCSSGLCVLRFLYCAKK